MEGSSWAVTTKDPPAAIGQVDEVKLAAEQDQLIQDRGQEQRVLVDPDFVRNLELAQDADTGVEVGLGDARALGRVDEAHGGFL